MREIKAGDKVRYISDLVGFVPVDHYPVTKGDSCLEKGTILEVHSVRPYHVVYFYTDHESYEVPKRYLALVPKILIELVELDILEEILGF